VGRRRAVAKMRAEWLMFGEEQTLKGSAKSHEKVDDGMGDEGVRGEGVYNPLLLSPSFFPSSHSHEQCNV
jgi:hypothetical protein